MKQHIDDVLGPSNIADEGQADPAVGPLDKCPRCNADFDGGPIPEEHRHLYHPPYRWNRRIGLYDRDLDRTIGYRCPDCGFEWPRE